MDYLAYGTITPHDVFKISSTLSKQGLFKLIQPYEKTVVINEPQNMFPDSVLQFIPEKFQYLFANFKSVYEQISLQDLPAKQIAQ